MNLATASSIKVQVNEQVQHQWGTDIWSSFQRISTVRQAFSIVHQVQQESNESPQWGKRAACKRGRDRTAYEFPQWSKWTRCEGKTAQCMQTNFHSEAGAKADARMRSNHTVQTNRFSSFKYATTQVRLRHNVEDYFQIVKTTAK